MLLLSPIMALNLKKCLEHIFGSVQHAHVVRVSTGLSVGRHHMLFSTCPGVGFSSLSTQPRHTLNPQRRQILRFLILYNMWEVTGTAVVVLTVMKSWLSHTCTATVCMYGGSEKSCCRWRIAALMNYNDDAITLDTCSHLDQYPV